MKNFPIESEGKVYWISRSVAVVSFLFAKNANGEWCVLANKRGKGCPDFNGYWNAPCGYLDWDEDAYEAAVREIKEETGLEIAPNSMVLHAVNSSPLENRQNVTLRFYSVSPFPAEILAGNFSTKDMEEDEVDAIKFIPISQLKNYNWAFGHYNLIEDIYKDHVKTPTFWELLVSKFKNLFK